MSCRGVHFALSPSEREALLACTDDLARRTLVSSEIEARWDEENLQETDKAWDAIHRCLGDFPPNTPWFYPVDPEHGAYALPEDHGTYPLKVAVLGGRRVNEDDEFYIIRLIEPNEVADLAEALKPIDRAWMRERYFKNCAGAWPEYGETDFEYTWEYFEALREFFQRVAPSGRSVIFTVDQ